MDSEAKRKFGARGGTLFAAVWLVFLAARLRRA